MSANKIAHNYKIHNSLLTDNYHWLRDKNWPKVDDSEILSYLKEENDYYHQIMSDRQSQQDQIYQELIDRIKLADSTVPILNQDYYYYSKTDNNSNYNIYCRKAKQLTNSEQVILDPNQLALGHDYFNISSISISPNHNLLAYSIDLKGDERYQILIKDLDNDQNLVDYITNTIGEIIWAEDNCGFYYLKLDQQWRSNRVYFHQLGTSQEDDKLIFQEIDHLYTLSLNKSADRRFIFINSSSKKSNETWFIDQQSSNYQTILFLRRQQDLLYYLDSKFNNFYFLINDQGKNFRLVKTLVDDYQSTNWQEAIAHNLDHYLVEFYLFSEKIVVVSKENGLLQLKIYNDEFDQIDDINFKDASYQAQVINTPFESAGLRISYSSLITPLSILEYDFKNKNLSTLKVSEVQSNYQSQDYQLLRLLVPVDEQIKVPVSLIYKKSLFKQDGNNPLYLYGYGSYGYAVPSSFRSQIFSLVNRGFIYAIAHIRGGDDLGYQWYEEAKFLTKKNTFDDFINVAKFMIDNNYTKEQQIVIAGGSAGGMLVGVCVNQEPQLYKAAIAHVPFVDVLNTMLDPSLPLTPGEFEEWGDPQVQEYFNYIRSYSPYDNIKSQAYPAMYVTAGISDPRVTYWESAKWVAKLREYKTNDNIILLETSMNAGHAGAPGRFGYLLDIAKEYNFIFKIFNINI